MASTNLSTIMPVDHPLRIRSRSARHAERSTANRFHPLHPHSGAPWSRRGQLFCDMQPRFTSAYYLVSSKHWDTIVFTFSYGENMSPPVTLSDLDKKEHKHENHCQSTPVRDLFVTCAGREFLRPQRIDGRIEGPKTWIP